jgi:hypothetical protein
MPVGNSKINFLLLVLIVAGLSAALASAEDDPKPENQPEANQAKLATPLEPLRRGVAEDQIFLQLLAHNETRKAALLEYTSHRTYQVLDLKGKVHAEEIGQMEFRAPDKKQFVVTSESGSGVIRHLALNPLIASEIETAAGKQHHDSAIAPQNYTLKLVGEQQVGAYHCFVAQVVPKRKDKYLFEGKMWIDVDDYAVVRIEGHPAKKLSFWIEHADFIRQYQKVDGFWLPEKDETLVQVRLYGKKVLRIEHQNYVVNGATPSAFAIAQVAVGQQQ